MLGLMQEWPLLCHKLIDNAERQHGKREIVSRSIEGRSSAPLTPNPPSRLEGRPAAGA